MRLTGTMLTRAVFSIGGTCRFQQLESWMRDPPECTRFLATKSYLLEVGSVTFRKVL